MILIRGLLSVIAFMGKEYHRKLCFTNNRFIDAQAILRYDKRDGLFIRIARPQEVTEAVLREGMKWHIK